MSEHQHFKFQLKDQQNTLNCEPYLHSCCKRRSVSQPSTACQLKTAWVHTELSKVWHPLIQPNTCFMFSLQFIAPHKTSKTMETEMLRLISTNLFSEEMWASHVKQACQFYPYSIIRAERIKRFHAMWRSEIRWKIAFLFQAENI